QSNTPTAHNSSFITAVNNRIHNSESGMKNVFARTLTSLLLVLLTLGPAAPAQSGPQIIKANIPFEFGVGNQVFPAGGYSLVSTPPELLELRDAEGHILTKVLTNSVEASKTTITPKLQFRSESGRYSL